MTTIKHKRGTTAQVSAYATSAQAGELVLDTTLNKMYVCYTAGTLTEIPDGSNTPTTIDWQDITNKPSTYTPSAHTHTESDITNLGSYVPTSRKVNNNNLSNDVTLDGSDIAITGYTVASSAAALTASDTVNVALGKLEKRLVNLETEIDGGVLS